jgi:hypothetical protein
MVRLPWSRKIRWQPEEPPVRLWHEIGILEEKRIEQFKWMNSPEFLEPKGKKLSRKDRLFREEMREEGKIPYHDRIHHRIICDYFRREWGTEVLFYVWWVGFEAIDARPLEKGFIIMVDLGPEEETLVGDRSINVGGRYYFLYWCEDLVTSVPAPELSLDGGVLSAKFYGMEIPDDESASCIRSVAGTLSIEYIAEQWIKRIRGLAEGKFVEEPNPFPVPKL